jgi:type II secretion system protein G
MPAKKFKKNQGFTLLELLVVISILGILTALLLVNFQSARVRSRDAARKTDLNQIKNALQIYYADYQQFPDDSSGQIAGCGSNGTTACPWDRPFADGSTTYMNVLPLDPLNSGSHVYTYNRTSLDSYVLYTQLENASDQDIAKSQNRCDPGDTLGLAGSDTYLVCAD